MKTCPRCHVTIADQLFFPDGGHSACRADDGPISPFWQRHAPTIDPERFRASPYFLDARGYDYGAALQAIVDGPRAAWLGTMVEDGAFGAETISAGGFVDDGDIRVSRDLLDSILELSWLEQALGPDVPLWRSTVLDVGAGYGRFVHRLLEAFPLALAVCTDAVPAARQLCGEYLWRRNLATRSAVALPEALRSYAPFDLAVNIHSWSECAREAVEAWLDRLRDLEVPRIFIVPHNGTLGVWSDEFGGGCGPSYRDALEGRGYREIAHGIGPCGETQHRYLFALEAP